MIVDQTFIARFKAFPIGKSHVIYKGERFRTYRETFKGRSKRDLCIAISTRSHETLTQFNLYYTSKTVRLKLSEGSEDTAINFINNFTQDTDINGENTKSDVSPSKPHARKRRFFKFLS